MKKINIEILFLFGFLLFVLHWTQGMFFDGRYGMMIIIFFIVWLWTLILYMYQSKKRDKLAAGKKDYKEIVGSLSYMGGSSFAVLRVYKDKLIIKETLFRLALLFLGKKEIFIAKDEIKEIKYLKQWPFYGINIITDKYVSEELVFSMGTIKNRKEKWQKILSEYGYKIE